jgi:transposase-like protein
MKEEKTSFERESLFGRFKLTVLRDYYESGMSLNPTAKKWGLSCYGLIVSWSKTLSD